MSRYGIVLAGALVSLAVLCAGCASTTDGIGSARGSGGATSGGGRSSPPDFPSAGPTSSAAGSNPVAVAPPTVCSTAACKTVKSYDLGGGFTIVARGNAAAGGGVGAAVVELTQQGTPVYWRVFDGETPSELACDIAGSVRNCVLVDYTGAHAATGHPIVLTGATLGIGEAVGSDTPGLHPQDLDGDNRIDLYGLQNNYDPDYASGKVQWQTWRRSGDGMSFTSTGCGPLSASAPTAPTVLQSGGCAS
jgi:hypothetical protein